MRAEQLHFFAIISPRNGIPKNEKDAALWRQRETILWLDAAVTPLETQEWRWEESPQHLRQEVSWALIVT